MAYCSYGQKIELMPSNPAPRIGQDVDIAVSLTGDLGELDNKTRNFMNGLRGDYTFSPIDTGTVYIGPLSFKLNGVIFQSDSIKLNILPSLPFDKMGVWVRQEEFRNKKYLVVEQIIRSDWLENKSQNVHGFDTKSLGQSGLGELKTDSFEDSQVSIKLHYAASKRQSVSIGKRSSSESGAIYRIYTYEISMGPDFKGEYIITRQHFNNLPKGVEFNEWILK